MTETNVLEQERLAARGPVVGVWIVAALLATGLVVGLVVGLPLLALWALNLLGAAIPYSVKTWLGIVIMLLLVQRPWPRAR